MDDNQWNGWPERWAGTDCDMRTVVAAIPQEVKDEFKYERIPWQRFPHCFGPGEEVPGFLTTLASGDAEAARRASALDDRLVTEDEPAVRVSLILAIAQLAREDHSENAPAWAGTLWSDATQPLEDRVGAALAWLCLTADPVPDELRTFLTHPGTDHLGELFQQVPWLPPVDRHGNALRTCIREMLSLTVPGEDSPWPSATVGT